MNENESTEVVPNRAVDMREVETSEDKNEQTDSITIKFSFKYLAESHQPKNIHFPFRTYCKQATKRCFKAVWFDQFSWLHYDFILPV